MLILRTVSASVAPASSSATNVFPSALLDMETLEDNAQNVLLTVLAVMETKTLALAASMDMLLIKSLETARKLLLASSDNTSLKMPIPALVSALTTLSSMKMSA